MNKKIKKKLNNLLRTRGFLFFAFIGVRIYSLLLRIRIENEQNWIKYIEKGGSVLLCVLHQQFFPLIRHFKTYEKFKPCIMISRSRDGDIIAPIAQFSGWKVARGSSSRGGKQAMDEMVESISGNGLGANIVDGPTGPIGKVKPGSVRIAEKSGAVMVPCCVIAESAWHFNSWDHFMVPKPFSKLVIRFGNMIKTDSIKTRDDFEKIRDGLEKIMAPYLII